MDRDRDDTGDIAIDLTPREREVARLVGEENLIDCQVAVRLGISVSTVRTHIAKIGEKLPGRGRTKGRIIRWWMTPYPRDD